MTTNRAGLGLLFVPLTVIAMAKVAESESGVAASVRNTAQQAGGSIGLAVLGTLAFTAAANSARASARCSRAVLSAVYQHALTTGFARGFEIAAGIMLLALIITVATIRIRRIRTPGQGEGYQARGCRRHRPGASVPGRAVVLVTGTSPLIPPMPDLHEAGSGE